jgi:hypothetical protein
VGRRKPVTAEQAAQDEEYLRRYLAAAQPRLTWLRERSSANGGPTPDELDLSRDSLVPLWEWAIGQFRKRPEQDPLDLVDHGSSGRYHLPRGSNLPMWFGRRPIQAPHWWSDETLALLDALIYYLAEAVRHAVPGTTWEIHRSGVENHVDEGQPVLTGLPLPFNPIPGMLNLSGRVNRVMEPDAPNPYGVPSAAPQDLRACYDAAVVGATTGP